MQNLLLLILLSLSIPGNVFALDADCYDKGEDYFIPASDILEAKKKALLCFFTEISLQSRSRENNSEVDFSQETKLEAKSALIDWQGFRKLEGKNIWRWSIKDVNENLKRVAQENSKRVIPIEKEIEEVYKASKVQKDIIEIRSQPSGAQVSFDGVENVCRTPCKLEVLHGTHSLSLWLQDYNRMTGTVQVDGSRDQFAFELKEHIGRLSFANCPLRTDVIVDGNKLGTSTDQEFKLSPGTYVIELDHPEYYKSSQKISMAVGQRLEIPCQLKAKMGGLEISAKNTAGEPVKANVEIDGQAVGKTPGNFEVRAGSRNVRLVFEDQAWESQVSIQKGVATKVSASLTPIESEQVKEQRKALRSFSVLGEFGTIENQNLFERKSAHIYNFKNCQTGADTKEGNTLRLLFGKNFTHSFGINIGIISGSYDACWVPSFPPAYESDRSKYSVKFSGTTVGLHYTLYNHWDRETAGTYYRWLTLNLSYVPSFKIEAQDVNKQLSYTSELKRKVLMEANLVKVNVGHLSFSLLNLANLGGLSMGPDSPVDLDTIAVSSWFGVGFTF